MGIEIKLMRNSPTSAVVTQSITHCLPTLCNTGAHLKMYM